MKKIKTNATSITVKIPFIKGFIDRLTAYRRIRKLQDSVGVSLNWLFNEAMGKTLYYLDDGEVCFWSITGIGIARDWVEPWPHSMDIPDKHKRKFVILTDSCWVFDPSKYGEEWFLDEDEAENHFKKVYGKEVI